MIRVTSKTLDNTIESFAMAQEYPIPNNLSTDRGQKLNWHSLAYDKQTNDYFMDVAKKQKFFISAIPMELIVATALRLSRQYSF